jgi:type VI secretion system secreted protein Hcp
LLLAAGAAGGAAAIAVADVPDSGNVIHACVQLTRNAAGLSVPDQATANMTVIDTDAGQRCIPPDGTIQNQTELAWNTVGPAGQVGAPGQAGVPGQPGAPGANGAPGTGNTFTITLPPLAMNRSGFGVVTLSGNGQPLTFGILGLTAVGKGAYGTGGGGGAGKVSVHDISITKYIDKASPKLFQAASVGTHIPKVTIELVKAEKVYLQYTLTNTFITSVQLGGGGGSAPRETVTFTYGSLKIQYTRQTATRHGSAAQQ